MTKPNLAPHQERVVKEKFELDEKIQALLKFLETELFQSIDEEEQYRLHQQVEVMCEYSNILHERILALNKFMEFKMTDNIIAQEIQSKGLTAPRITPEHIEASIDREHYFTANDGIRAATGIADDRIPERLLTFCVLVLRNGFTVTGESACASPENFDAELGRKIARANAINKIWPLEGYLLKEKLFNQQQ